MIERLAVVTAVPQCEHFQQMKDTIIVRLQSLVWYLECLKSVQQLCQISNASLNFFCDAQ